MLLGLAHTCLFPYQESSCLLCAYLWGKPECHEINSPRVTPSPQGVGVDRKTSQGPRLLERQFPDASQKVPEGWVPDARCSYLLTKPPGSFLPAFQHFQASRDQLPSKLPKLGSQSRALLWGQMHTEGSRGGSGEKASLLYPPPARLSLVLAPG